MLPKVPLHGQVSTLKAPVLGQVSRASLKVVSVPEGGGLLAVGHVGDGGDLALAELRHALALRYAKEGEPEVRGRDVYSTRRGERLTGQLGKLAPFIPEEVVCLHWGCQPVLVCKHDMGTPRIMEMGISMEESRNSWRGQSS